MKYKAAISYSHADQEIVAWLHRRLEAYRVPRHIRTRYPSVGPRLGRVFRDREELGSAADLSEELKQAFANTEYLLLICSPAAARSHWVNEEVKTFTRNGRGHKILCCLVEGEIEDSLPPELAGTEPLAADLRTPGEERKLGLLKLIAGLLGVGFDELRQREQQAQQRRLIWITTASITGMLIATTLALLAYFGQQEAARQAEVAQRTTDFMIDMFEVSDPGVARGSTVTARQLLDSSAAGITALADQPYIQARLQQTMASVYANLGLYDQAAELQQSALTSLESLAGHAQEVPGARLALGHIENLRAAHSAALPHLEDAILALESEGESVELASALNALGLSKTMLDERAEAEALYRRALEIRARLLAPDHPDIAETQIHLGWLLMDERRYDEAKPLLERALASRRATLGDDHFLVADAYDQLGALHLRLDDPAAARPAFEAALAVRTKVLDPGHPRIGRSEVTLGETELSLGRFEAARVHVQRGLNALETSLGDQHLDLTRALEILSVIDYQAGRFEQVLAHRQRILSINEAAFDPDHLFVAQALNNLGALLSEEMGRHDDARPYLERAVDVFSRHDNAAAWEGLARWSLANCLRDLGFRIRAEAEYNRAEHLLSDNDNYVSLGLEDLKQLQADKTALRKPQS